MTLVLRCCFISLLNMLECQYLWCFSWICANLTLIKCYYDVYATSDILKDALKGIVKWYLQYKILTLSCLFYSQENLPSVTDTYGPTEDKA